MTATSTSGHRGLPALAAPLAAGCCMLAGAGYVAAVDPSGGGLYPACPFRVMTGWWCPGCGMTRAVHHLLRGDIVQALRFNLFVALVLAGVAAGWLGWLLRAAGRPTGVRVPPFAYGVAVVMLVGFGVLRNLPGIPGLRG